MPRYDSGQLVFAGRDLSPFTYVEFSRPLLPPSTVEETSVPGRPGALYRRRQLEAYDLPVSLHLRSRDKEDIARLRHLLASAMLADGPQRLVLPDDPGRYYMAAVSGACDIDALYEQYPHADVTFRILDPVAYGQRRRATLKQGLGCYDFGGTYPASPVFTAAGRGQYAKVTDRAGGLFVRTAGTVSSGATVRFDMANERTTVNGADKPVTLDSDYFGCVGAVEIYAEGVAAGGTVEWDERWL